METIILYRRVSTEGQRDQFSLQTQRERGLAFAQSKGFNAIEYEDVWSGRNITRDGWQRMVADLKRGKAQHVWAIAFDRLNRDTREGLDLIDAIKNAGASLYINDAYYDVDDPNVELMITMSFALAKREGQEIKRRATINKHKEVNEGKRRFCFVYGYDFKYLPDGKKEWFVLEHEAEVVKRIYDMYLKGHSYSQIARKLNDEGIRTKKWGWVVKKTGETIYPEWERSTISLILHRPEYIGKTRNKQKQLIDSIYYKAIIDEGDWYKVQSSIESNRIHRTAGVIKFAKNPLSGLLRCGLCGKGYFIHKSQVKRKGGEIKQRVSYSHKNNRTYDKCDNRPKYIDVKKIDDIVAVLYLNTFRDFDEIKKMIDNTMSDILHDREALNALIADTQKEIDGIQEERKRIQVAVQKNIFDMDEAAEQIEGLNKKRKLLNQQIEAYKDKIRNKERDIQKSIEMFSEDSLSEFIEADDPMKRSIYKKAIRSLSITHQKVKLEFVTGRVIEFDYKNPPAWLTGQLYNYQAGLYTKEHLQQMSNVDEEKRKFLEEIQSSIRSEA